MGRMLLIVLIGAVIVGLWARSAFSEKKKSEPEKPAPDQKTNEPTELNKHPERLDQMLDPTDDA
ncbi:MAG TPA: hypothetical protein VM146_06135 [Steroidobacteraceae bacterium]|nr:hypothetical protein [Steroidobacteraceae bacterium]